MSAFGPKLPFARLLVVSARITQSGRWQNNQAENSHLPFRRRERAMQRFKTVETLQQFVSYHSQIYNHFNHQRHLETKLTCKQKRSVALIEWHQICAF
jgi:putative transposase